MPAAGDPVSRGVVPGVSWSCSLRVRVKTGRGFVWVAGEATCLTPMRPMLRNHPALDAQCVDVDGYWRRGTANHDHHGSDD